jgi:hypothetical protein
MGQTHRYNPQLGGFERRDAPSGDEQALSLLDGYPGAEEHVAVNRE